jgi:hypothetical protein
MTRTTACEPQTLGVRGMPTSRISDNYTVAYSSDIENQIKVVSNPHFSIYNVTPKLLQAYHHHNPLNRLKVW